MTVPGLPTDYILEIVLNKTYMLIISLSFMSFGFHPMSSWLVDTEITFQTTSFT